MRLFFFSWVFIWDRHLTQPFYKTSARSELLYETGKKLYETPTQNNKTAGCVARKDLKWSRASKRVSRPQLHLWDAHITSSWAQMGSRCHPKVSSVKRCNSKLNNFASQFTWDKTVSYKAAQVYMRQHLDIHLHFLTTLPSKKNKKYMWDANAKRDATRVGVSWQYISTLL